MREIPIKTIQNKTDRKLVWLALAFAAAVVLGSAYYWSQLVRRQGEQELSARHGLEKEARQINYAVNEQLESMLMSIDVVTRHLATVYLRDRRNFAMAVKEALAAFPEGMVQFVTVFDAEGYLAYSSNGTTGRLYFGDQEHFLIPRDNPSNRLFVSKPIIGRIAGVPLIQLSRAIRDGNKFHGVIGLPIRPDYLSMHLFELHRNPRDLISVVRHDGSFLSRSRNLEGALNQTVPADRPYLSAKPGEEGIFRSLSIIDQVPLMFSWSRLRRWPINIVVGLDEQASLAPMLNEHALERQRTLQVTGALLLAAVAIAYLLMRVSQNNKKLAESEYRFRHFFESNKSVMLLIHAGDGQIVAANAAASAFYGYPLPQLQNMSIDAINTLSPSLVAAERQQALREERNYLKFKHRLASGEIRQVEVYSTLISMDGDGLLFSIIHDVTDKLSLQCALENELGKSQAILRNASDGICIMNRNGRIEEVNDAFCTLLGYSRDEMIGMHASQWDAHIPANGLDEVVTQAFDGGGRIEFETIHRTKNGNEVPVEVSATPIAYRNETFLFAATRNITERKQFEHDLVDHRRRLNDILAGTNVGTWEWNVQTGETTFNERWAEIVGYTLEELQPVSIETWTSLVHPDDLKRSEELLGLHFAGEQPYYECEARIRHKDGHWVWVLDRGKVSGWTATGKPGFMSGTHQDISRRKRDEQELRRYRDQLEEQVQERTLSLSIAKEAAEAANRLKTIILRNISHEFRTPMNGIMGMLSILKRRLDDPKHKEILDKTELSARRLLLTLNDLIDLAAVESGRMTLDHVPFDVSVIMGKVSRHFAAEAQAKGLTLTVGAVDYGQTGSRQFMGDPLRLEQILFELVGNAIKFSYQGNIGLQTTVETGADGRGRLNCTVVDTGVGIRKEDLHAIFEPFMQVDGSATRAFGGNGIGLALCRQLASLMGGIIEVASVPGEGSRFTLRVPLTAALTETQRLTPEAAREALRLRHSGAHVLVAEHDVITMAIAMECLESADLTVFGAGSGSEAIESAQSARFDLILLDLNLPGTSGIDAAYAIRAMPHYARTPMLAMTASPYEEDREECLRAGFNGHVPIPITPELLLNIVLEQLD